MQLGGDGRGVRFETFLDAFFAQDNYSANTGNMINPKNLVINLLELVWRWKLGVFPIAIYGQVVGEDEDNFLPNCLMFQYGFEAQKFIDSTLRMYFEYTDLTSYWWTGDPRTRNISHDHHIYGEGFRYQGRPVGHWADQDSRS